MHIRLAIMFLLLLPVAAGEEFIFDSSLYSAQAVTTDIKVSNIINIIGRADELEATLYYTPHETDEIYVREVRREPEPAEENEDALIYRWEGVSGSVEFAWQGEVTSQQQFPHIRKAVDFPYRQVPPEYSEYLQEEEIIQITPEIRSLAAEIIGDEDDAVRAVFLLGSWVKDNIEYDLNTVTAEASQTSQWVLDTRTGVCDELTSLFIAMVRSQGIPARFVSGIAYTNLETLETNWGPHGWAEIWYPDIGWVPYDVTYGQYGFVDATHIPFQYSTDARTNAAEYSMRSRGAQMQPRKLVRQTQLIERGAQAEQPVNYEADVAIDEVGFGSANRIDVIVENPHPYYVSTEIFLARTQDVMVEDYSKSILLGPREETTISWVFTIPTDLNKGFYYTFPLVVYTNRNTSVRSEFTARSGAVRASIEELSIEENTGKRTLAGTLECDAPQQVKQGEEFTVSCEFERPVELCIETTCEQTSQISETFSYEEIGAYTVTASANEGRASKQQRATVTVTDEPRIAVKLETPTTLGVSETGSVYVRLEKTSYAIPEDIIIDLEGALFQQRWELEELRRNATLELRLPGNALINGENEVEVTVTYTDEDGIATEKARSSIYARPKGFSERFQLWMNWLASKIR